MSRAVEIWRAASEAEAAELPQRLENATRLEGGDVLLPIGFSESTRIPVESYLANHPQ